MGFLLYISYHGAFIYSYGILLYGCIPSGLTMTKIKDYDLITVDEHRIQTTIDVYFQWRRKYVRKNMSGVVPTLTANQGEGGHNVCLVKTKQGIRKMTPKECFNTQGFPESFVLPDIADGRLYKQAGNSVCVSVVQRIAEQMLVAMK